MNHKPKPQALELFTPTLPGDVIVVWLGAQTTHVIALEGGGLHRHGHRRRDVPPLLAVFTLRHLRHVDAQCPPEVVERAAMVAVAPHVERRHLHGAERLVAQQVLPRRQ